MKLLTPEMIEEETQKNPLVLYMKGTPLFPMDSNSAFVCQNLDLLGVSYLTFDLLKVKGRSALEEKTKLKTAPFLFAKGHFVGAGGALRTLFKTKDIEKLLIQFGLLIKNE
ncbi:MAG: hypothetical protein PHI50_02730 [Alphaproteobacteria bacterium]|nr:hypothetical protein [Alphaproteobacteria bacterium]